MRVLLALFLGLWASVANADFYTGVLQQQAQQTTGGGGPTLDCSTATCIEETICASGCDYTTIVAWEDATDVDLTSGGAKIYIGTLTEDITTTGVTITGATNASANARRILRGATALDHIPGTSANIKVSCAQNFSQCLLINEDYLIVEDLSLENTGTTAANTVVSQSQFVTFNRAILKAANGTALTTNWENRVLNSILYDSNVGLTAGNFATSYYYNVTLANNATGYLEGGSSSAPRFKNTVFQANTTDVSGDGSGSTDICHGDSTTNATSAASAPTGCDSADGTWVLNVASGDFVNQAIDDWMPSSGGVLDDAGADNIMTGDTNEGADWPANIYQHTNNEDVSQYDRGTANWDIGAVQYR